MTSDQFSLRVERLFDFPRDVVFSAWVEPGQMQQWFHFSDEWEIADLEIDPRAGGTYRVGWRTPDGQMWYERGEYLEVTPPERLVHTCRFDFPGNPAEETLL